MFTGIIEGLGTVRAIGPHPRGGGKTLSLEADFALSDVRVGDSVAVNGACLTATTIAGKSFTADVSAETLSKTALGALKTGGRVNLERALALSGRLDGHLVSGHVDCVGHIRKKQMMGNAVIMAVGLPESFPGHIIPKGSIAVDGVSLTLNTCAERGFEVALIPHTAARTTLDFKKPGDAVNIETDMIGKYVEKVLSGQAREKGGRKSGFGMDFLAKNGFL
ncbi:Riboflavin synthase [Candidatus Desulfarcum epimagneticum]|uniref:Riboflavin synthase n=1 Tax=uncultured Desulfobacteraceae bacterium TaxID=218296 RepID=A0A484HKD6_9BACT|nr:Riboflavin synthase [uncultured Desulfobacteraceae bacterium]